MSNLRAGIEEPDQSPAESWVLAESARRPATLALQGVRFR